MSEGCGQGSDTLPSVVSGRAKAKQTLLVHKKALVVTNGHCCPTREIANSEITFKTKGEHLYFFFTFKSLLFRPLAINWFFGSCFSNAMCIYCPLWTSILKYIFKLFFCVCGNVGRVCRVESFFSPCKPKELRNSFVSRFFGGLP